MQVKALTIKEPGGPEVLRFRERPEPECSPDEVRVRIRATALNRADLLQRRGLYPAPPDVPADVPGLEFAGEVETVGDRVGTLRPGDRVMGIVGGGSFAERIAIHERLCLPVPPSLGFEEAAAIPEAFFTAFDALFEQGRPLAGETLLIHAAASGVGTAAVQLARATGAFVLASSRSADKRNRLETLGADQTLDAAAPDARDRLRLATGGAGVDVVLDLVGAAVAELNLDVLARHGRWVVIGLLGGARAQIDLARLMQRHIVLRGSVLRSRPLEEKIALTTSFAERILPLFAAGRLRPVVGETIDWSETAQAHARMERNETFGKVVVRVSR